jgi:hypothetical protein
MTKTMMAGLLASLLLALTPAGAQSLTSGDISGTITDPSGAVIANAAVTLTSIDTGSVQNGTTSQTGTYRFSLLKPGVYSVVASQAGFEKAERKVELSVGQLLIADLRLAVGAASQTIEVSADAGTVSTDPAQVTSFTASEVALLPSAGGDITNIADTAPGVIVNTTGGYGNFTANGLPATSNLFTVNGENDMDPYFNINNSGASNLTLGANEIQEVTVTTNPYSGQYGQLAGAQVSYITKSGTNEFHGNGTYSWNGRDLNANDWFSNATGTPRPFANANQWAAGIGGPIIKNKTFFYLDYEALNFVLPNVDTVEAPTPQFASAILANVQTLEPAEAATYQKLLGLYANAPGASGATPLANSDQCNALQLPGFNPGTTACSQIFESTPTAHATEWILAGKIDHQITENDHAFFRFRNDEGTQPTYIDPISSNFDALSNQPAWDAQVGETHIFGPSSTNEFIASLSHYQAQFVQNDQKVLSTLPYGIAMSGTNLSSVDSVLADFPQGRNITQWQLIDNYTLNKGKHTLKFGENFRRYDVSDHNFFYNYPEVYFGYNSAGLQNFADGVAYQYRQSLNLKSDVPVATWGIGVYGMDEWAVRPNLKITLALRVERSSNPVCHSDCFANFNAPFTSLPSATAADPTVVPYSSDISYGQKYAFPGVDAIDWSPRFGFSYSPGSGQRTVVSGGIGIFYDGPPAGLLDDLLANPPNTVAIRVRPANGTLPFDPAGGAATWAASAGAYNINQSYSQISASLAALGSVFAVPAFTQIAGTIHSPETQEWNLQVQRSLTQSLVLTLSYNGNHTIKIPYTNAWPNAYDPYGVFPTVPSIEKGGPLVPNYGEVQVVQSGALSNYNGGTVSIRKRFSHGFSAHFNYTYAHGLDEVSNGGIFTYGDSVLTQINPLSLRANNYGNSDYDIRHSFNGDWVYSPTYKFGNKFMQALLGGWQYSGKIFWRSGLPFSVVDGNLNGAIPNGQNITSLADPIAGSGPGQPNSCGAGAAYTGTGTCLNVNAFLNINNAPNYPTFPAQDRNQYRGPHYFDTDMAINKLFNVTERLKFGVGLQAFNAFNHPNFGLPDNNTADATFGQVTGMASTTTTPYGSFLGFDASPRILQITGKFVF